MAIKSNFLLVAVVCLLQASAWGRIEITSISQNARNVGLYDKFELSFTLSQTYSNPFDPSVVDAFLKVCERGEDSGRAEIPATPVQADLTAVKVPVSSLSWSARAARRSRLWGKA